MSKENQGIEEIEEISDQELVKIRGELVQLESKQLENYSFASKEEYQNALDSSLNPKHMQTRDLKNGKFQKYYPSPVQKAVADFIFQEWNTIDIQPIPINSAFITVQVKIAFIPSYPGAKEEFCAGLACTLLNTAKNNLEFQLPSTISKAVRNALQQKGNIFGRNLSTKFNDEKEVPNDFSIRKAVQKVDNEPKPLPETSKKETASSIKTKPEPPKQTVVDVDDDDLPF